MKQAGCSVPLVLICLLADQDGRRMSGRLFRLAAGRAYHWID